jgi:putative phosphoribosyl transferase
MIVALPVLPRPAAERLSRECDRLVTLRAPQRFQSVGQFYESFQAVSEERVRELLAAARPVEQPA